MGISETKEKNLRVLEDGIRTSQRGLNFAKQNLNTLNMDHDPDEEAEEEGYDELDPTRFMTKSEVDEWNRLSPMDKEEFLREGEQEAKHSLNSKNKGKTVSEKFRVQYEELQEQEQTVQSAYARARGQITGRGRGFMPHKSRKNTTGTIREQQGGKSITKAMQHTGYAAEGAQQSIHAASTATSMATAGTGAVSTSTATAAASTAVQAGTAAATGGVTAALKAGKKTADAFRQALEAKAMSATQSIQKTQHQLQQVKEANQEIGALPSAIKYAGAAGAAAVMAVAAVLVQVAASLLITVVFILAAVIFTILAAVIIVGIMAAILAAISSLQPDRTGGAQQIVEVALAEEGTTDGTKYWTFTQGSHFVDGSSTPWCACFVSWCGNECGLIDAGVFPKSAAVATYREFFREKGQLHEERSYIPQTGDLILFGSNDHIGIVQYTEGGRVITIEGNTSDAVHTRSYALESPYITGYCSPEYPAGTEIAIPEDMGVYHTYMGWQSITSPTSLQYQLREESGEHYDEEGFAKIGERYVIACTTTFGGVGDYVDFYREDGTVIKAVIGDIKNRDDPGCNEYGHANGRCVVEYVVQQSMWYPAHPNPGTAGCHPEWNSRIVKAVKSGRNYFN